MVFFVALRLLGCVCVVVSIHCRTTIVRAQDTTALRRAQVLDQRDELPTTSNEGLRPDSSTRILHNFFRRRVPKTQQKHSQPPPLYLPPPSHQHSSFPPPSRKPLPSDDLFATKYSLYKAYYKVKSGGSMSKRHHAYHVKGGKQFRYHHDHSVTSKRYDIWYDKSNGIAGGGGKRWKTATNQAKMTHKAGLWWKQLIFIDKTQYATKPPPPPKHIFLPLRPPPPPPPPPADDDLIVPPPDTPGTFTILGPPVTGQAGMEDQFGRAVASSRFGNYMAVGAPNTNGSAGIVRVYQLLNGGTSFSSWDQVGQDIEGPEQQQQQQQVGSSASNSLTGFALDINDDGTILVVGDLGIYNQTGQVRVFSYNAAGDRWVQRGNVISGDHPGDIFGAAVSISSTGDIVVVGAPGYTIMNSNDVVENIGQVRAYIWNSSVFQWDAFGNAMYGDTPGDLAGFSVSLSSDGQTMAYGLPTHDVVVDNNDGVEVFLDAGQVRVVQMDSVSGDWISLGNDPINGVMAGAEAGWDIQLSGNGNRIIVGMPGTAVSINVVATEHTGIIRVYELQEQSQQDTLSSTSSSSWVQYGQEFIGNGQYIKGDGETPGSRLGQSVAMSSDGMTIAFFGGPVVVNDSSSSSDGAGRVPVYVCNANKDDWIQRDNEIIVDIIGPRPYAVSLSATGSIVLVGAIGINDVGTSTGYISSSRSST